MKVNEVAEELERILLEQKLIKTSLKEEGLEKIELLLDLPIFAYAYSQNMLELSFTLNVLYNQVKSGNLTLCEITLKKIEELIDYENEGGVD